ncbi:MAG: hypothetical protein AAFV86_10025, partial [Pseudomonadota bacterium]
MVGQNGGPGRDDDAVRRTLNALGEARGSAVDRDQGNAGADGSPAAADPVSSRPAREGRGQDPAGEARDKVLAAAAIAAIERGAAEWAAAGRALAGEGGSPPPMGPAPLDPAR